MTPIEFPAQPMADYLAMPAVSASLISDVLECPRLAWFNSWLNPDRTMDDSAESDAGSIAHSILLEGSEAICCVIDPNDHPAEKGGGIPTGWTNKSIRRARDIARESGLIPVLSPAMAEIRAMVAAALEYVVSIRKTAPSVYAAFNGGGQAETTFAWKDGETLCKMRPDMISNDRKLICNYKTTATSVDPERWGRGPFLDYYVGAAWYARGVRALFDVDPAYVYLVQSTAAPYLCSLIGVAPQAMAIGGQKCEVGLKRWQRCVDRGEWPGYSKLIAYPELSPWEVQRWEEAQANDPELLP